MAWSEAARRAALEARRRKKKANPRLKQVNKTYSKIKRSSVYEDRLEYTHDDLSSTYDLDRAQGRLLYRKMQTPLRKGYAEASARSKGIKSKTQQLLNESRSRATRLRNSTSGPELLERRKKAAQYLRKYRKTIRRY